MKVCVGLTGNLASGKTTVAQLFQELGIDVFSADEVSRELTQKDQPAYKHIVAHFGSKVLLANGQLDRVYLREIVFSQAEELRWLEQLLHPLIREGIQNRVKQCKTSYCVIEIPLAIDRDLYPYLTHIILVTAPLETQITRVQSRDSCSREQALAILAMQPSLEERLQTADLVIDNNGSLEALKQRVQDLHLMFIKQQKLF